MKTKPFYKELTVVETIEKLEEMVNTRKFDMYDFEETIYNAVNYLNAMKTVDKIAEIMNKNTTESEDGDC